MSFLDILDKVDKAEEDEIVKVAGESISTEVEKEYCVWVKPTEAGWQWLEQQEYSVISDILLPTDNGRRRVRIKGGEANLTLKRFSKEGTKEEHSTVGMRTALSFYDISPNVHVFKRMTIPAPEYKDKAGDAKWDIDVFFTYGGNADPIFRRLGGYNEMVEDMSQRGEVSGWVKVELEVERFFTNSIRELIPFECHDILPSRTKDPAIQALLSDHWDVVTNWK